MFKNGQSIKIFEKKMNKMYVCLFVWRSYIQYLVNLTILNGVDLESSFCLNIGGSFEQQQSLLVHRSSHR